MRYLESENPYIICRFTTGDTVKITIYDLSDNSKTVDDVGMTEILTTGYFKYQFNPSPAALTEYMYVSNNTTEEHAGKIILGGFPDGIKDQTDKMNFTGTDIKSTLDSEEVTTDTASRTASKADVSNLDTTVSSRSSHTAANVWAAGSRELSTPNSYKADVSSIPTNPLLTNDARLNNLDTTISSRSNHSEADVWTTGSRELSTPDNYKATVTNLDVAVSTRSSHGDPTSSIKGTSNKDLTQVFNNEKGTDGAYTGTPPTVAQIRTEMDTNSTKLTNIKDKTDTIVWTDVTFLSKIIKNKKELAKNGSVWELIVYDDDGVTPILNKELKDKDGNNITDLAAGTLAQELANSV